MGHIKLYENFTMSDFTSYTMRVEAPIDALKFIQMNYKDLIEYHVISSLTSIDTEIKFSTRMKIDELLKNISKIQDNHIMYRTLNYTKEYTGKDIRE